MNERTMPLLGGGGGGEKAGGGGGVGGGEKAGVDDCEGTGTAGRRRCSPTRRGRVFTHTHTHTRARVVFRLEHTLRFDREETRNVFY